MTTADALAGSDAAEVSGKVVDLRTGEVVTPHGGEPAITEQASREMLAVARQALREAESLPALASLAHRADVTRIAARKAKLSEEACLDWAEFSLDAQRDAGRMLAAMDKNTGAQGIGKSPDEVRFHDGTALPPKLDDLGVTKKESHRWQAVASLPDEVYEDYKEKARVKGEITRAGAVKLARQAYAGAAPAAPIVIPAGVFSTLVADPPWLYGNTSTRAAAQDHYDTLSIAQLCGDEPLPDGTDLARDVVLPRAAERAHLYLWATAGHLPDAFKVMAAWGFTYKTYLVWVKPQMGMGNDFRVSTELVLFGVKGDMRTQDMGLVNWFEARRGKHSAKPHKFYDLVAKASPGPYLEMFARCDAVNQLPGTCQCSRCLPEWDIDWEIGKNGELFVIDIIQSLKDGARVETTTDIWAASTGNIYIEYSCRYFGEYKPSGISVTTAEIWALVLSTEITVFAPVDRLQAVARYHYAMGRRKNGGLNGTHPTWGVLIPVPSLLRDLMKPPAMPPRPRYLSA